MRSQVLSRLTNLVRLCGLKGAIEFLVQWLQHKSLIEAKVAGISTKLLVRHSDSDIFVLWQVFGVRQYDVEPLVPPRFIIDGGANVGYTSIFFAEKYPEAQIVAIEPERENFELLRRNCLEYPNIHLLRAGLWISEAYLRCYNPGELSYTFHVSEVCSPTRDSVKRVTIPELIKLFNVDTIDILKLDIEGSEKVLFSQDCEHWIPKVRLMIVETHGEDCERAVLNAVSTHDFVISHPSERLLVLRK